MIEIRFIVDTGRSGTRTMFRMPTRAGRTLDALINFWGMKIDSRITFVDTYLHDKIKILGEYVIHKPSFLKLVEPQVVCISGNSAEDQLAEQAYSTGIRHVIKFSKMFDQI